VGHPSIVLPTEVSFSPSGPTRRIPGLKRETWGTRPLFSLSLYTLFESLPPSVFLLVGWFFSRPLRDWFSLILLPRTTSWAKFSRPFGTGFSISLGVACALSFFADHPDHSSAVDDFALVTDLFFTDALTFITAPDLSVLLVAVYDPASGQIVGTELYRHPVAREDADEILSHASRYVRQKPGACFSSSTLKHRVGQRLYDRCHYFNRVFPSTKTFISRFCRR